MAAGIEVRHQSKCRTHRDGVRCSCRPSYRASVFDSRTSRLLKKTFGSETDAKAWRAEATTAVRDGKLRASRPVTLREAADAFLDGIVAGTIQSRQGTPYKPSTARSYREALRLRVLPVFGAHRLADITRRDLQLYVERLQREGVSASRIANTINPVRAVYRRAVDLGDVAVTPCDGLRLPAEPKGADRFATPGEAAALIAVLPERYRPLWATAFYAGLRCGELQALRWGDIDLKAGTIRVERSWDREAGIVPPKSGAGIRTVPVPAILRPYLDRPQERLRQGPDGLVFPTIHGNVFERSNVAKVANRNWKAANKKAIKAAQRLGRAVDRADLLEPINLHACRHSYASYMIAAGVNAKALSTYMGHASVKVTLDRYGHLMPGNEGEAAELLDIYLAR